MSYIKMMNILLEQLMDTLTNELEKLNLHKKSLGQYFTTDITCQDNVIKLIKNNPDIILEPSCGRGDLVKAIQEKLEKKQFILYEIDKTISILPEIKEQTINYEDFLETKITQKFPTIVGNPPYVSQKGTKNMYIQFITKCVDLLSDNGELIFIVPFSFIKCTAGVKVLNKILQNGSITDIYHPNDEKLFAGASIDIIIFRYEKGIKTQFVNYNDKIMKCHNDNGFLTFMEETDNEKYVKISDIFTIHVGLVSGLDKIFKSQDLGNVDIKTDLFEVNKFIFIDELPEDNSDLMIHLQKNKEQLMNRKICKITENNWYKFGAIRNLSVMTPKKDKKCIYVRNITRKDVVSTVDKIQYFSGSLLALIPKDDYNLDLISDYINTEEFKRHFMSDKRFIISHNQLSNSLIPEKYKRLKLNI
jgi:adenine-specific DNA-methyltransferase